MRMKCEQFIPDRLRDYYTAKISLSNRSSPALSSVVTAVVSVTTVISENHQVSRIMSGQSLERVQVDPQTRCFVIDRDSSTAEFIQKFRRRQTADFCRPPQRHLFALVKADGDVHQGIPFVQRDVGQPLAWNGNGHFEDEGSPEAKIWKALRLFAIV